MFSPWMYYLRLTFYFVAHLFQQSLSIPWQGLEALRFNALEVFKPTEKFWFLEEKSFSRNIQTHLRRGEREPVLWCSLHSAPVTLDFLLFLEHSRHAPTLQQLCNYFPFGGRCKPFPQVPTEFVAPYSALCSNVRTLFSRWDLALSSYLKLQFFPSHSLPYPVPVFSCNSFDITWHIIYFTYLLLFFPLKCKLCKGRDSFLNQYIPSTELFLRPPNAHFAVLILCGWIDNIFLNSSAGHVEGI